MKRVFDVVASLVGLVSLSPILLPVAVAIWLQDFRSPFYVAIRTGRGGRPFRMVKFRSMGVRADRTGVDSTSADDPRVTPVGRFVRRFKLDELPQLWNVLCGDMSLVGPRPNVEREAALYTSEERRLLEVRPGITDLASIVFADEGDILRGSDDPDLRYHQVIRPWKSRLGLLYVRHAGGLRLDLRLIWLTLLSAARRDSALARVMQLVRELGGDEELARIARRTGSLPVAPPPGAREVVRSRLPGLLCCLWFILAPARSWTPGLHAQAAPSASRLLETDHWAYEYLRRLRSQGYVLGLDPLAQPYQRTQVARSLAGLVPDTLPEPAASWVRLLRAEFASDLGSTASSHGGALVLGGARSATSDRLDALRPVNSGGVWPWGEVGGWVESGPLVAETRILGDTYWEHDPDGRAPHLNVGGLSDHTYVSLRAGPADLVLGRLARNWGPVGTHGLLVSDNPLSYPQVGFDVRLGRFGLQAFTAELDTLGGSHRYLAANRVAYVGGRFALAFTESILYSAGEAGPSLQLLNPLTVLLFEHENPPAEDRSENLMLGIQFWHRAGNVEVYGEGLLDDIDLFPESPLGRAPTRYGATLGVRWRPLRARAEVSAEYERVSSYAYRSYRPQDRYDYLSRGLGDNFADYDRTSLALDLFPLLRGLRLTPALQLLRQGEGDLRVPFPDNATLVASPSFLIGVVERTYRFALRGRYQPARQLLLTWDLGEDLIRNAGHLPGSSGSKFVALGQLALRFDLRPGPP